MEEIKSGRGCVYSCFHRHTVFVKGAHHAGEIDEGISDGDGGEGGLLVSIYAVWRSPGWLVASYQLRRH